MNDRRRFLKQAAALVSGSLVGCAPVAVTRGISMKSPAVGTAPTSAQDGLPEIRLAASSGFAEDTARTDLGVERLLAAGFAVSNTAAAYRRSGRFAGSDAERAADWSGLPENMPQIIMGLRGGYGAMRILPLVDWASVAAKINHARTAVYGFSDMTAIQAALLAKGGAPSFCGPMLYSEIGRNPPDEYTIQSWYRALTEPQLTVVGDDINAPNLSIRGTFWGGNLSVLAALAGSPYMPAVDGGILFLEDVGEQPYRIERMMQTLLLAGILKRQQAIVLGSFRMTGIRDVYDEAYTLSTVVQDISRLSGVPVVQNFPFGHVAQKTSFPIGLEATLQSGAGEWRLVFDNRAPLQAADTSRLIFDGVFSTTEPQG